MTKHMRAILVVITSLVCLGFSVISSAKTFKIATLSPEGSFWFTTIKAAGKDIAEQTDQRVKFRFYPGGVMGSNKTVLKKIRIGQLQGAALSSGALASKAPNTQVYNIPLLFRSYEEVDYVRQHLDTELEEKFKAAGFVSFGLAEAGFAYIMSKAPIVSADELKRNKVWVPSDDPASQSAVESFDLAPVTLSVGDVLTGLQTKLINTVAASPIASIALQWHTQVNYVLDLPIVYIYALLAVDQKAFDKVSSEDQKIVDSVMRKAFKKMDTQNRKDNQAAFAALENAGVKTLSPNAAQLSIWKDKTRIAADNFAERGNINPDILNKIHQLLSKFRTNSVSASN